MTLRLTPEYSLGKWMGRWHVSSSDGVPIGEVYQAGGGTRCVALVADVELAGPTLARTMTAVAAVLEHAAGYVIVDEPGTHAEVPCSRVIREAERSPIRVDDTVSTPIRDAPTVTLNVTGWPPPTRHIPVAARH